MNRQHAIDHAEFDTTFASTVDPRQRESLDDFVRTELMRVVDEVFDDIDGKTGEAPFCLDRLEIDLGEINLRDYRQQMPQRLRRQLWQVLDNARFTSARKVGQSPERPEASSAGSALLHFLRYGYLPRSATIAGAAEMETLLLREIETNPERLLEFISRSAQRDSIFARLSAQFPAPLVERIKRLYEAPAGAAPDPSSERMDGGLEVVRIEAALLAQFDAALMENEQGALQRLWPGLVRQDAALLAEFLRDRGRHTGTRQRLARLLSAAQFAELVALIESNSDSVVLALLEHPDWLPTAAGRDETEMQLREYLLGYLLVERGQGFDRAGFIDSLLSQIVAAEARSAHETRRRLRENLQPVIEQSGLFGELAREMLSRIERHESISSRDADMTEAYRRFARVAALFSSVNTEPANEEVLLDIDVLMRQAPWLILRLVRELQTTANWRPALRYFSEPLLQRLVEVVLILFDQVVTDTASAGSAELAAAVTRHAARARDRQAFYAEVFARLVADDLIDFEQLRQVETIAGVEHDAGDRAAIVEQLAGRDEVLQQMIRFSGSNAMQAVQSAELITIAGLAAGLRLSSTRLREIKWRLLQTQLDENGALFDLARFTRRMVATLLIEAGVGETREAYGQIAQALLTNSLPATRDLTRRMIDVLQEIAAQISIDPLADERQVESTPVTGLHEVAPDEDIRIDNAGLVLLAPWLPRLFDQFGLLDKGEFRDRAAAERAVHCAQFLVDGSTASPEFQLVLNKLICGVRPGKPICRSIELSEVERGQLESLLTAVTQHWKVLENTSIDGLRESFLQRGGRLQRKQDAWHLSIESRSFDMLLDQIPWSYSTIKFAWMDRVIYVDWR